MSGRVVGTIMSVKIRTRPGGEVARLYVEIEGGSRVLLSNPCGFVPAVLCQADTFSFQR